MLHHQIMSRIPVVPASQKLTVGPASATSVHPPRTMDDMMIRSPVGSPRAAPATTPALPSTTGSPRGLGPAADATSEASTTGAVALSNESPFQAAYGPLKLESMRSAALAASSAEGLPPVKTALHELRVATIGGLPSPASEDTVALHRTLSGMYSFQGFIYEVQGPWQGRGKLEVFRGKSF